MDGGWEKSQETLRFGQDFELDVSARRLSRAGRALRLERIPAEILLLLMKRTGQVVTRQDIVAQVWGAGAFLDTDNSINGAVRKIRLALKDDVEKPRFVETIPGRGYRFIAPIDPPRDEPPVLPQPAAAANEPQLAAGAAPARIRGRRRIAAAAAVAAIVAWAAGVRLIRSEAAPSPPARRVMLAVLPFDNLTGDPAQNYFSDGLTEEMIARLGGLNPDRLGVIGRASVMRYARAQAGSKQAARDLGVQYLLEGSVRRGEGRVRISAQLVRATDQTQLWAREFDRDLGDLLAVQDEIARAVAEEIQLTLGEPRARDAAEAESLATAGYEAYDLYLRGRYFWNKRTTDGFQQAVHDFEQAAIKDPTYARTYAGLADAYALMVSYGMAPGADFLPKARFATLRALALDDRLAEAHASLGLISLFHDWDWVTAEREYRRATQLDANYATAHQWHAELLAFQGRFDEAMVEADRARALEPMSLITAADYGVWLYFARQYDRAIAQFRAVLRAEPGFPRARMIALALVEKGEFDAALQSIRGWRREGDPAWNWILEAYVHGRMGRRAEARQALAAFEGLSAEQRKDPLPKLALAYAGMGEVDKGVEVLQQAYAERSPVMVTLKTEPAYDSLRGDPRFRELLRRVGLEGR